MSDFAIRVLLDGALAAGSLALALGLLWLVAKDVQR